MTTLNRGDYVANIRGLRGTVIQATDLMVQVAFEDGRKPGWFDREGDERLVLLTAAPTSLTIDLEPWTRLPEVLAYARSRGVVPEVAVRELVNHGLSHWPFPLSFRGEVV